jgi:nucleotide-binding universal stress UspA family protein
LRGAWPVPTGAPGAVLEYQKEAERALRESAKRQVADASRESGRDIEWRESRPETAAHLVLHARHADLTVLGQEDPGFLLVNGPSTNAGVLIGAGRPVLMVPYAGQFKTCGESVLIAWNGSREAARAAADALPLLREAAEVNIVSFNPKGSVWGEMPGADIGLWLARHGVRVTVHERRNEVPEVGDQILSLAADMGSDLLVMGAYGHSRAFEMVLGGVTRKILQTMTIPVMFSH